MTKYVVKRVLLAILTVFIVCAITFFAMNAIPGGPFDGEKAISDEVRRVLEQRFNLDKPVWEQFFLYLNNLLHGDLVFLQRLEERLKRRSSVPLVFLQSLAAWRF